MTDEQILHARHHHVSVPSSVYSCNQDTPIHRVSGLDWHGCYRCHTYMDERGRWLATSPAQ